MQEAIKKQPKAYSRTRSRMTFYIIMIAWPVIHSALFYFYVNFSSILMAFQSLEITSEGYKSVFTTERLKFAWEWLFTGQLYNFWIAIKFFIVNFPISFTLALTFSFYIYKKYPGAGIFKVMLFMPSIVSSLVFCIIYKYLCEYGYAEIVCMLDGLPKANEIPGFTFVEDVPVINTQTLSQQGSLLTKEGTSFFMIVFYDIWISFGTNILLYSGAMSGIDESVIESAQLDGANLIQEFIHISLPLIFPTITSLLIVTMTTIFTATGSQLSLYGEYPPDEVRTIGFSIYVMTQKVGSSGIAAGPDTKSPAWVTATSGAHAGETANVSINDLAAFGLILSCFIIPIVLTFRKLMKKYGPSVD